MSSKKAAKKAKQRQKKAAEQGRALLVAAGRGDRGTMGRLLESGLDVNALVESGEKHPLTGQPIRTTALVEALEYKQAAAARLLLDRGADPNLANSVGCTPLMAAATKDSLPLLRLLVEAKAELNAVMPITGMTAFLFACSNGSADCAEALVRAGCDTSLRDKFGKTGRDYAQEFGHTEVLERLRSLDAQGVSQPEPRKQTKQQRQKKGRPRMIRIGTHPGNSLAPVVADWLAEFAAGCSSAEQLHRANLKVHFGTPSEVINAPQKCGSRSPKEGYSQAGRGEAFLYAESADGIKWTKPVRAALFSAFSKV